MKYIKKYNNFLDEGLMDFIKKNLKGLIDSFSENTKNIVGNSSKSIENIKDYKESKPLFEKTFTELSKNFNNQKNYKNIKNFVKDDLSVIELLLSELSQKFEPTVQNEKSQTEKKLKPNTFFQTSNDVIKRIFNYENSNDFQVALNDNLQNLMLELAKKSGIKNPEEKFNDIKNESKLYEAQEDEGENLEADESFKKFKQTTNDFRNNGLFKFVLDNLDKIEIGNGEINTDYQKIVDSMKGSTNKKSLNQMINKFISSDKDALIALRDAMGFNKNNTPL